MTKLSKFMCSTLLTLIIFSLLTMPASAGGIWEEKNVTAKTLTEYLNSDDFIEEMSYIGWTPKTKKIAEYDEKTNTVKLLCDMGKKATSGEDIDVSGSIGLYTLKENIIFDLNGHSVYISQFVISDDNNNTFTFKDSVGNGKIVGGSGTFHNICVSGSVTIVFESGTYIGNNALEYHSSDDKNTIEWIHPSSPALSINSSEAHIKINGGTFIGGNGLDRSIIDENLIQSANSAIYIEQLGTLEISGKALIKGGNGENSGAGEGIYICGDNDLNSTIKISNANIYGGSGTVGGEAIYSDIPVSIKITDTMLYSGSINSKNINAPDGSNIDISNTSAAIKYTVNDITVTADANIFHKDTVISVEQLKKGTMFDKTSSIFSKKSADYKVYEICAKVGETLVQPNGKVKVTFNVPKNFNIDKTAVYYVSSDGKAEKLKAEINAEKRTAIVSLDHFSTYVLVDEDTSIKENKDNETLNKTQNTPDKAPEKVEENKDSGTSNNTEGTTNNITTEKIEENESNSAANNTQNNTDKAPEKVEENENKTTSNDTQNIVANSTERIEESNNETPSSDTPSINDIATENIKSTKTNYIITIFFILVLISALILCLYFIKKRNSNK